MLTLKIWNLSLFTGPWNRPNVKPSTEVSKSTSTLVAVIDITLENRRVVNSKAHLVAFKSLMSIKCVFR